MRVEPRVAHARPSAVEDDARARVRDALALARRFLPSQPPLDRFVHHNPLHSVEHLHFEEAVVLAADRLGAEPYPTEAAFSRFVREGRISPNDLEAVAFEEADEPCDAPPLPGDVTRRSLRMTRLFHPSVPMDPASIRFAVEEGITFSAFDPDVEPEARLKILGDAPERETPRILKAMWARLDAHVPPFEKPARLVRPRDRVLRDHGVDVDSMVHPVLIQLAASFLDRGISEAKPAEEEKTLLRAFRALYAREKRRRGAWTEGVESALARHPSDDAEALVVDSLRRLAVPEDDVAEVVELTLLSLRGWAGMIASLEAHPEWLAGAPPGASLLDLLAVALVLEAEAVAHIERSHRPRSPTAPTFERESVVFEAFTLAQHLGLGPALLESPERTRAFIDEVVAFGDVERRRLWFLAYERAYVGAVLDALALRGGPLEAPRAPSMQAIFCIDDREESLRRHIEELAPTVETLGYAGFFGVAMAYQGATDARPRPLCPPGVAPRHRVTELAVEAPRRSLVSRLVHALRGMARVDRPGGILRALVGLSLLVPFALRILAPAAYGRFLKRFEARPRKTRLVFERDPSAPSEEGFTVDEMADVVAGLLRTTGLEGRLAPLVVLIGHGATSVNNPHEAAYNCGATGGGHGGPNARVFAKMANHPGVRAALRERGVPVDEATLFVGGHHDTCDDSVTFYDLDEVSPGRREELERMRASFDLARRRSAHERCRRFESASLELDPDAALAHVEGRAASLSEPRPECGHVTNALCVVGSRELTRGLFLDRRAFLVSYDPARDPDGAVLGPLLETVLGVCGGISLEYYFSYVDPQVHGCGTKVAHNVAALLGVVDGAGSDLRTGLPAQMIELHEPLRLFTVVEAEPELLVRLCDRSPSLGNLIRNEWVRLAVRRPGDGAIFVFRRGIPEPYVPEARTPMRATSSAAHYRGERGHLPIALVGEGGR